MLLGNLLNLAFSIFAVYQFLESSLQLFQNLMLTVLSRSFTTNIYIWCKAYICIFIVAKAKVRAMGSFGRN